MRKKANTRNATVLSRIFDGFNVVFLMLYGLVTLLPFLYIIAASFATEAEIVSRPFFIWPREPTLLAFKVIFTTDALFIGAQNSFFITLVGTAVAMVITVMTAYSLTRNILGRKVIMKLVVFCMIFNGGMIPTYIVISGLGLLETQAAVILPAAMSIYNMIIVRNFFFNLPPGLTEAAEIDGAGHFRVLWQIVLPLSTPVIATFSLFYMVSFWNQWFNSMLYNPQPMWPLQVVLRAIVMQSQLDNFDPAALAITTQQMPENAVKFATILVATLPIMLVYPFLQKHFTKGVMIGAIKG